MMPLQPRSTLFPYTTLFRSGVDVLLHGGGSGTRQFLSEKLPQGHRVRAGAFLARRGGHGGTPSPDRKSTRLNSSHTVISYAVFCLKKKKIKAELSTDTKYH